jgi:uncharacterized protein (UPF0147 family)
METLNPAMQALHELGNEDVPRNVKLKVDCTLKTLQNLNGDGVMNVNRALHELEELTDDCNLDSFTRMRILNIVSLLESATHKKH